MESSFKTRVPRGTLQLGACRSKSTSGPVGRHCLDPAVDGWQARQGSFRITSVLTLFAILMHIASSRGARIATRLATYPFFASFHFPRVSSSPLFAIWMFPKSISYELQNEYCSIFPTWIFVLLHVEQRLWRADPARFPTFPLLASPFPAPLKSHLCFATRIDVSLYLQILLSCTLSFGISWKLEVDFVLVNHLSQWSDKGRSVGSSRSLVCLIHHFRCVWLGNETKFLDPR